MIPLETVTIDADWLRDERLQQLFDHLTADGAETMVNGGAVRNTLLGEPVTDVDLCTTLQPDEVVSRLQGAGMKTVPTGIEHGTVTVVTDGARYEVTTLREDVETDGRHAVVKFGTDWQQDAARRDLTINALYCDRDGRVYDPLDGMSDLEKREVRFIGDAEARIHEDALRILRFFRFFAWYGSGRPDAKGLKACAANRELIARLSSERVWAELKKLLAAPDPGRALLWMRTTGVLSQVLPESEKWGIDAVPGLLAKEAAHQWPADPLLRLMAIVRPHLQTVQELAKRLSMSNKEVGRLAKWAESVAPKPGSSTNDLDRELYLGAPSGIVDAIKLEIVHLQNRDDQEGADQLIALLEHTEDWKRPSFPLQGRDLVEMGFEPGPRVGEVLERLETSWVESGFKLEKSQLIKMI